MNLLILPTSELHFEGLRQALDVVAREKHYLAFFQAPPIEVAFAFYRNIVANALCQVIALDDGVVVGWCDVLPTYGEARAHVGILGMGLVPNARRRGIGAKLMEAGIQTAWAKGFSRIELTVRTDNARAKALYARFGFVVEAIHRNAFCVDGAFFDTNTMALLR